MGIFDLFKPKISKDELNHAKSISKKITESHAIYNKTVKPDMFFGRFNATLDFLMHLQLYEKHKIFKENKPTEEIKKLLENMENEVDDFIQRSYNDIIGSASKLKAEKAKQNKLEKWAIAMISAFEMANTFWVGTPKQPHYNGPLYTEKNLANLKAIIKTIDPKII